MSSTAAQRDRTRNLLASLREAGLGEQVQLGIHVPTARPLAEPRPEASSDGFPLDGLLRPLERTDEGRFIEIAGERSSGRTALAYRLAAGAAVRGELAAWVDLANALDPRFLRRSGADLETLLWVRPPRLQAALRAAELLLRTGFGVVVLDLEGASAREIQRLGAAVWTRLLRAVRESRASTILLHPERVSGASATLGLYTERDQALFERGLFEGLEARASVLRNRRGPTGLELGFRVLHRPSSPTPD